MKKLLNLFFTSLLFAAASSHAVEIKIATLIPNQSQWMQDMRAAGKEIEAETEGRVRLKFYGGGSQGTEDKVLQKIKIGQLHGGTFSPTDFIDDYAGLNVYGLPFVFNSWDEVHYVRQQMDDSMAAGLEDLKFQSYGFVGSFSMLLSNEPISQYQEMRGKKVWLPEGDTISYEAMRQMQLSPVALPVTDVLTGLQTGLLDIAFIPPEVAIALQWHTRVKYITDMPVSYATTFLAISDRALRRVSDADKAVLRRVLSAAYEKMDVAAEQASVDAIQALGSMGIEVVQPADGQFEELRRVMAEKNQQIGSEGAFPLEVYNEVLQHLATYRQAQAGSNNVSADFNH